MNSNIFHSFIHSLCIETIIRYWVLYSKYYENLTEMTEQMSKSGFFISRPHIGRDSGFSSKIGVIPTKWDGWTVCNIFRDCEIMTTDNNSAF